jgi:putative membrane protein
MKPYVVAASLILAPLAACSQSGQTTTTPAALVAAPALDDRNFVEMKAQADMFELAMAQAALQKSRHGEVRRHATAIQTDHNKAMLDTAQASPIKPASTQLDARRQQMMARLNAASGGDFDRLYTEMQIAAHQEAIQLHQNYVNQGQNAALKQVASMHLPILQQHLAFTMALAPMTGATVPRS